MFGEGAVKFSWRAATITASSEVKYQTKITCFLLERAAVSALKETTAVVLHSVFDMSADLLLTTVQNDSFKQRYWNAICTALLCSSSLETFFSKVFLILDVLKTKEKIASDSSALSALFAECRQTFCSGDITLVAVNNQMIFLTCQCGSQEHNFPSALCFVYKTQKEDFKLSPKINASADWRKTDTLKI